MKRKAATAACALAALIVLGAMAASFCFRRTPPAMSADELQELAGARQIDAWDGGAVLKSPIQAAKNPQSTLHEVSGWLRQAKSNGGWVPKTGFWVQWELRSEMVWQKPPEITITEQSGQILSVQPAFYYTVGTGKHSRMNLVKNVLAINTAGGKTSYIRCAPLYDWLENGGWKAEFQVAAKP